MGLPYLVGVYAEALGDSGRLDAAGKSVEAALDLGRYNGTYFQHAEVLRIEACIRERSRRRIRGDRADAAQGRQRRHLQRSAIGQLRIALELARRLQKRGNPAKARQLLAPHAELVAKLGDNEDARAAREFL